MDASYQRIVLDTRLDAAECRRRLAENMATAARPRSLYASTWDRPIRGVASDTGFLVEVNRGSRAGPGSAEITGVLGPSRTGTWVELTVKVVRVGVWELVLSVAVAVASVVFMVLESSGALAAYVGHATGLSFILGLVAFVGLWRGVMLLLIWKRRGDEHFLKRFVREALDAAVVREDQWSTTPPTLERYGT